MIIQIDGTNSVNKGAELMFYAIAQEIERRYPQAVIRYVGNPVPNDYFNVINKIVIPWYNNFTLRTVLKRLHLDRLFNKFVKGYYRNCFFRKDTDIMFDASGLRISDKFRKSIYRANRFNWYLSKLHKNKTFIVFLPQAFGPLNNFTSRKMVAGLNAYADVVMAREDQSYKYLKCMCNAPNILIYPDFTSLVSGVIPQDFAYEAGYITVIPNSKMITQKIMTEDGYMTLLSIMIEHCLQNKRKVIILNHEGNDDAEICRKLTKNYNLQYFAGYNSLEVKGIISRGYLTISSRYHGVANSLNSGVPCLATSWNHKYEKIFEDYNQKDCVLNIHDTNAVTNRLMEMMDERTNYKYRTILQGKLKENQIRTHEMWDEIWKLWDSYDKRMGATKITKKTGYDEL